MVQGDIVKRIWSTNSQISEHNDILDIWDTGSHIYERWPNGDELYWKIVSREETQLGFIEILQQEPMWKTPAQVLRREQMPLLKHSASQFQLGGWSVEQVVERACSSENMKLVGSMIAPVEKHKHSGASKSYNKNQSRTFLQQGKPRPRVQDKLGRQDLRKPREQAQIPAS